MVAYSFTLRGLKYKISLIIYKRILIITFLLGYYKVIGTYSTEKGRLRFVF